MTGALIPREYWAPFSLEEFRTPVMSLFDQVVTDMFKGLDPFNDLTNAVKNRAYPKVDIRRLEDDLVFEAALPFVKKEDLNICIKDSALIISGTTKKDETIKDGSFIHRELVRSSFTRSFPIDGVLLSGWEKSGGGEVEADLSDGLLTIKLKNFFESDPTTTEDSVRKIEIA
jgi:HSP20 family molecular chaperone IbpA